MNAFQKWRLFAPLGLTIIGLGLSLLGHSIQLKIETVNMFVWFSWGTLSLITINAGLAIFGDAVKHRVLFELKEKESTNS